MQYNRGKGRLQTCSEELHCNRGYKLVATNVCDCCVCPMEDFLRKSIEILSDNGTITVFLTSGQNATGRKEDIFVADGIIGGTDIGGVVRFIPICQISRVVVEQPGQSLNPNSIKLLPPVFTSGECDCCERPTRKVLSAFPQGKQIELFYVGLDRLVPPTRDTFEKVGLGITLTSNEDGQLIGYSNCKITGISEAEDEE